MAKLKILVIEDEEDILELETFNLTKEGYQALGVTSGEDGLRAVRVDAPDLIVLDLMLPGISGMDVCRVLKQDDLTRNIPIIMVTAKGE
ncbi:MAG: response regulator, partial [bacterium]